MEVSPGLVRGAYALARRDLDRFWRYKWWLAGLITMNLTDLFVFALVFNKIVNRSYIPDYFFFIAPGIAAIATFASAFSIGREVGMELRRGYTQYLLSLPLTRPQLAMGRILGGGIRGLIYQIPFLALLIMLTGLPGPLEAGVVVLTSLLLTFSMSGLSISIFTTVRSFDLQATLRGFVYFLLFFFSNVFYPDRLITERFPQPLYQAISNNPVSIATTLYRWAFTRELVPEADPWQLLAKLFAWFAAFTVIGGYLYLKNLEG